tara:strand:+ start:130118 stop:130537 length:420 start_codon:yes stop_codon:yes gene_type:complete
MPDEKMDYKFGRYFARVAAGLFVVSGGAISAIYLSDGRPGTGLVAFLGPLILGIGVFWATREKQDELERHIQLKSYAIAGLFCIASSILHAFLIAFGLQDASSEAAWSAQTQPGFFMIVSAILSQFEYYRYAKPDQSAV